MIGLPEIAGAAIIVAVAAGLYVRSAALAVERRFRAKFAVPPPTERDLALRQLGTPARDRAKALEAKCAKTLAAYGDSEELVIDGNRRALAELQKMHLRLLTAQREVLTLDVVKDEAALRRQLAAAEELEAKSDSAELRTSSAATAVILRRRLENVTRRETHLQQIESDLQRIEALVELALEDATLNHLPAPVSHSLQLASGLFDESLRQD